jgi:acyl-CoA thioester hydrolase
MMRAPTPALPQGGREREKNAKFELPIRIYWEDTDAGGIVFYANYLKFFERSRTEWLRSLGIAQQRLKDETGGLFVVTQTSIRYHRPARLDDELVVTASLLEIGRASLIIKQQALLKTEQTSLAPNAGQATALLCEGTIRIGWVDAASLRPTRMPASLYAHFPS